MEAGERACRAEHNECILRCGTSVQRAASSPHSCTPESIVVRDLQGFQDGNLVGQAA